MQRTGFASTFTRLLLGSEPEQRRRVLGMLVTAHIYLVGIALTWYAMSLGLFGQREGWALNIYVATTFVMFYVALRCNWCLRKSDPDMAMERTLLAIIGVVMAYAWGGPTRSNALLLLSVVMVLSMFGLSPRQILVIGFASCGMLGLVVGYQAYRHPGLYPWAFELAQFGLAACCLPAIAIVARQIQQLRKRLTQQRQDLREAVERVQHLAQRDPLTGLINRRHMQELVMQELQRQERGHGSPCTLALVDMDWFKRINDTHGHAVGDQVLVGFARLAQEQLRPCDVVARWGGEEFLVLLPRTSVQQATYALNRLNQQLAQTTLADNRPELRLTVSVGLAEPGPDETLDQVLERVDQALYRAKAEGRNRIVAAAPPAAPAVPRQAALEAAT